MAEKREMTKEEMIAEHVALEKAKARKNRKSRRGMDGEATVTINSLMDAMTIILIFLLMNYSTDPLRVDTSAELQLPESTTEAKVQQSVALTVQSDAIILNNELIVEIKEGKVVGRATDNPMKIPELTTALTEAATQQKERDRAKGKNFEGLLTLILHDDTPYELLLKVLYSAGQAEFSKFQFAVSAGGRFGFNDPAGSKEKGVFD